MLEKIINRARYKLWFAFDLPIFIKERRFARGAELGVKGGRSIRYTLAANPQLHMIGIDLWEKQPGKAYLHNEQNENRCRKALQPFRERVRLYKGDANILCDAVRDESLDFVFYDIYNFRISAAELHETLLLKWIPKLRPGGVMIGRDFHSEDIAAVITELGYELQPCMVNGRPSPRLKYFSV